MRLVLYQREACPYCQVVRKKLTSQELPALMVPVEKNGEDRKELLEISGQQKVLVLVDDKAIIVGSTDLLTLNLITGSKPIKTRNRLISQIRFSC